MLNPHELKVFLARLIGWTSKGAVDRAFRSIELAVNHRAPLVLLGEGDLVPIAHALHRRTLGADQPFILCDPHRGNAVEPPRWPETYASGVEAAAAAAGGSLCVCRSRLPRDLEEMVAQLRRMDNVLYMLCSGSHDELRTFLMVPAPIEVPSLTDRAHELPRIVDEYARDAIRLLGAPAMWFTDKERSWVLEGGTSSLSLFEIEIATMRLVALKMFDKLDHAAQRLGISHAALRKWLKRRAPLPGDPDDEERAILVRDVEASFAEEEPASARIDALAEEVRPRCTGGCPHDHGSAIGDGPVGRCP